MMLHAQLLSTGEFAQKEDSWSWWPNELERLQQIQDNEITLRANTYLLCARRSFENATLLTFHSTKLIFLTHLTVLEQSYLRTDSKETFNQLDSSTTNHVLLSLVSWLIACASWIAIQLMYSIPRAESSHKQFESKQSNSKAHSSTSYTIAY